MSDLMVSVTKLLEDLKEFDSMDGPRKGAFRARVTRYLNQVEDEKVRAILERIRERVGEAETRSSKKLTVEDLEEEFPNFREYSTKRRGAYKAKVTRLQNEAKDEGDSETVARLETIQDRIASLEEAEQVAELMALAETQGLLDEEE